MSVVVSGWVWQHAPVKSGELVVLLALADNAHDDGAGAYPSQPELAGKSRMQERQVRNCLVSLEAKGLIKRQGQTRSGVVVWRVVMDPKLARQTLPGGRQPVAGQPGNGLPPEPSLNHPGRPSDVVPSGQNELPSSRSEVVDSAPRATAGVRTKRRPTYNGKAIPRQLLEAGERLLALWNETMGRGFKPYRPSDGRVSDHLKQIVGMLLDRDDVSEEQWAGAIRAVKASPPGWAEGRALQIGDVFGKRAADHVLSLVSANGRPMTPESRDAAAEAADLERRRAAAERARQEMERMMGDAP